MSASSAPPHTLGAPARRWYWLCQLLGWGGYGVLYYLAVLLPLHAAGVQNALADGIYCTIGLGGTHLLRGQLRRRDWAGLPAAQLLPRLLLGVVVLAAAMTAGLEFSFAALGIAPNLLQAFWPTTGSIFVASCGLSALWLATYWIVLGTRRRRAAETQALQAELLARDAQLRRLQAQLNPHFLFNCLNSVRALISQDPARAQAMVTRLSELLRYALQADRTPAVPFAEEWSAVEDYLALERMRLEERLEIRHQIAPSALAAAMPPMLLQGLVENAIKHGIAPRPEGGSLSIEAAVANGQLRLEVRNSGRLQPATSPPPGAGVGLANARQRLQLLYGAAAGLQLDESPPGSTRAVLTLPYSLAETAAEEAVCAP